MADLVSRSRVPVPPAGPCSHGGQPAPFR